MKEYLAENRSWKHKERCKDALLNQYCNTGEIAAAIFVIIYITTEINQQVLFD